MGYDVYILKHPYTPPVNCKSWDEENEHFAAQKVRVPRHDIRGGTYAVGGSDTADLAITFNYAEFFCKFLGGNGINDLNGLKVSDTLPKLLDAVMRMKGEPDADYWKPTEGNARAALTDMLLLALLTPETTAGYWHIEK